MDWQSPHTHQMLNHLPPDQREEIVKRARAVGLMPAITDSPIVEFGQGIASSAMRAASGIGATLTETGGPIGPKIERAVGNFADRRQQWNPAPEYTPLSLKPANIARTIGGAVGDTVGGMAVGALATAATGNPTAGTVAGVGFMFARTYGDTLREYRETMPDATDEEIDNLAFSSAAIQSAIEYMPIGVEPKFLKNIGRAVATKHGTRLAQAVQAVNRSVPGAIGRTSANWLKSGLGEGLEEVLQGITDDLAKTIGGADPETMRTLHDYLAEFVGGTIGGMGLGMVNVPFDLQNELANSRQSRNEHARSSRQGNAVTPNINESIGYATDLEGMPQLEREMSYGQPLPDGAAVQFPTAAGAPRRQKVGLGTPAELGMPRTNTRPAAIDLTGGGNAPLNPVVGQPAAQQGQLPFDAPQGIQGDQQQQQFATPDEEQRMLDIEMERANTPEAIARQQELATRQSTRQDLQAHNASMAKIDKAINDFDALVGESGVPADFRERNADLFDQVESGIQSANPQVVKDAVNILSRKMRNFRRKQRQRSRGEANNEQNVQAVQQLSQQDSPAQGQLPVADAPVPGQVLPARETAQAPEAVPQPADETELTAPAAVPAQAPAPAMTQKQVSTLRSQLKYAKTLGLDLAGIEQSVKDFEDTGKFDADYADTLDAINLAIANEQKRQKAQAPTQAKAREPIGQDSKGADIFQDEKGARYKIENGFRITEAVRVSPTRGGVVANPTRQRALDSEWTTNQERDAAKATSQPAATPAPAPQTAPRPVADSGKPVSEAKPQASTATPPATADPSPAPAPAAKQDARQERREQERTQEDADLDALWGELNSLASRMSSGIDPQIAVVGSKIAAIYIKKGVRNFRDFAAQAREKLGANWDKMRRQLRNFWNMAADLDEMAEYKIADVSREEADAILAELEKSAQSPIVSTDTQPGAKDETGNVNPSPDGGGANLVGHPGLDGNPQAGSVESTAEAGEPGAGGVPGGTGATGVADAGEDVGGGSRSAGRGERSEETGDAGLGRDGIRGRGRASQGTPDGTGAPTAGEIQGPDRRVAESDRNHVIEDGDTIAPRGETAKFDANIRAIELLYALESAGRNPTPQEKKTLAAYTGWGGMKEALNEIKGDAMVAFDNGDKYSYGYDPAWAQKWGKRYIRLRNLLSPAEFSAAARSSLNAHYTVSPVIRGMWKMARRLGFKGGRVGEFGAGVGHFLGMGPAELRDATNFTAVELDEITGRILKHLYPQARVEVSGLEQVKIAPNSLSMVIGNFPFDRNGPHDPRFPNMSLHDYFFARAIDAVAPGGLVVAVTSHSTMDTQANAKARKYMAERANLVAAYRLPNDAFKDNAGTEVVTDIIILQKKGAGVRSANESWYNTMPMPTRNRKDPDGEIDVNEYYHRHPENMFGTPSNEGKMYGKQEGGQPTFHPIRGMTIDEHISKAVDMLKTDVVGDLNVSDAEVVGAKSGQREGSYHLSEGKLVVVRDGELVSPGLAKTQEARAMAFVGLKQVFHRLHRLELSEVASDADIEAARKDLRKAYKLYTQTGSDKRKAVRLRNPIASKFLASDPDYYLLCTIEEKSRKTVQKKGAYVIETTIMEGSILSRRVNFPWQPPKKSETLDDALLVSMMYNNGIVPEKIAELLGVSEDQAIKMLNDGTEAYLDPKSGEWTISDEYLSGNIASKLADAEALAAEDPRYNKNVVALMKAMPESTTFESISFDMSSRWVPAEVMRDYLRDITDTAVNVSKHGDADVWNMEWRGYREGSSRLGNFSTNEVSGLDLVNLSLAFKTPVVMRTWRDAEGNEHSSKDMEKTLAAEAKQKELHKDFVEWIGRHPEHRDAVAREYNKRFGTYVDPKYHADEHFEAYPGAVAFEVKPATETTPAVRYIMRPHQRAAVRRMMRGSTFIAHGVGKGKTGILTTAAMELKRLGLAHKSMIVVHNSTLEQYADFVPKLYPNAKLLIAGEGDLSSANRHVFLGKVATNDWDIIVIAHSSFDMIADSPIRAQARAQSELADLKDMLTAEIAANGRSAPSTRALEQRKKAIEKQLHELLSRKIDDTVFFEDLGVDALFVDEAHKYKKNFFQTAMENVKGLDKSFSKKAFSMSMKLEHVREKTGGKNVFLATGTPVTNTLAEIWNMVRYVNPDLLKEWKISTFDQFAQAFAEKKIAVETDGAGRIRMIERFAYYKNVTELATMFRQVADVVLGDDGASADVPSRIGGQPATEVLEMHPVLEKMVQYLNDLYEWFEGLEGKDKREFSWIPLTIFTNASKASIDMRLIGHTIADDPGSKLNKAVENIEKVYREYADSKGTQSVFLDLHRNVSKEPTGKTKVDPETHEEYPIYKEVEHFNAWREIKRKLVERGIPESEIAVIDDYKTKKQREMVFDLVRQGTVRIVIGSTETLGTGVNMQDRMIAIHHVDAPMRPADMEQRNGRVFRQGNMFTEAYEFRYGVRRTLDAGRYQMLDRKGKMVDDVLTKATKSRTVEEGEDDTVSYAEAAAAFSGDRRLVEKVGLEVKVKTLQAQSDAHDARMRKLRWEAASWRVDAEDADKKAVLVQKIFDELSPLVADQSSMRVTWPAGGEATGTVEEVSKALSKFLAEARAVFRKAEQEKLEAIGARKYDRNRSSAFRVSINGVNISLSFRSAISVLEDGSARLVANLEYEFERDGYKIYNGDSTAEAVVQSVLDGIAKLPKAVIDFRARESHYKERAAEADTQLAAKFAYAEELEDASSRLSELQAALEAEGAGNSERGKTDKKGRPKLSDYIDGAADMIRDVQLDAPSEMDNIGAKVADLEKVSDTLYVMSAQDDIALQVEGSLFDPELDIFIFYNKQSKNFVAVDGMTGLALHRMYNSSTMEDAASDLRELIARKFPDRTKLVEHLNKTRQSGLDKSGATPRYGLKTVKKSITPNQAIDNFDKIFFASKRRPPLLVKIRNKIKAFEEDARKAQESGEDIEIPLWLNEAMQDANEKADTSDDPETQKFWRDRADALAKYSDTLERRQGVAERAIMKADREGRAVPAGKVPNQRGGFYRTGERTPSVSRLSPADKMRLRRLWEEMTGTDNIQFVERLHEGGKERLGKFQDAWATIAEGQANPGDTLMHEAVHAALDFLVSDSERARLLAAVNGNVEALAEGIIRFANEGRGLPGQIRRIAGRVIRAIRRLFGAERGIDQVNEFYDKLIGGDLRPTPPDGGGDFETAPAFRTDESLDASATGGELVLAGQQSISEADNGNVRRLPRDFFRSYTEGAVGRGVTLEQFKRMRFVEAMDQTPGEIAEYHGIPVDEFLLLGEREQFQLWNEALGDIAEESYEYEQGKQADPRYRTAPDNAEAQYDQYASGGSVVETVGDALAKGGKQVAKSFDRILGTLSARIEKISPELLRKSRELMANIDIQDAKDMAVYREFVEAEKRMPREDRRRLEMARLNADNEEIHRIITKNADTGIGRAYTKLRKTLDAFIDRMADVGLDVNRLRTYHPRKVEDYNGLISYLKGTDKWTHIQREIDRRNRKLGTGNELSIEEQAMVADQMLRGTIPGLPAAPTDNTKSRSIDWITPEMMKFYAPADVALAGYIRDNNRMVEWMKFLGAVDPDTKAKLSDLREARKAVAMWAAKLKNAESKTEADKAKKSLEAWERGRDDILEELGMDGGLPSDALRFVENSIGMAVTKLAGDGKLTADQETELKDMVQALWNDTGITNPILSFYRDTGLLGALGQFSSAITQIQDLAWSFFENGTWHTAKGLGRALAGRSRIKRRDIMPDIMPEFSHSRKASWLLSHVLRWTGMEFMDTVGKEALMNASVSKMRGEIAKAKAGDRTAEAFVKEKLERVFGDDFYDVMADILNGNPDNPNVQAFTHFMLSEYQPLNRLEVPEAYKGNARVLYMLKTYQIKQLNNYRVMVGRHLRKAAAANDWPAVKDLLKDISLMALWLAFLGAASNVIKDLIYGREIKADELTGDVLGQLVGLSRWDAYNIRREGLSGAVLKRLIPQNKIVDNIVKDITQADERGLRSTALLPVFGKFYYWQAGRGAKMYGDGAKAESDRRSESRQRRTRGRDRD